MKVLNIWQNVLGFFTNIKPAFFKNNFEITSTKVSKIIGAVIGSVSLLLVVLNVNAFTSQDFSQKWILLGVALALPFIIGLACAYGITIKKDGFNKVWHFIFLLLMPIVAITVTECLNGVFIYD